MEATQEDLAQREALLQRIETPVSDEEACALAKLIGPDECFGLNWSLVTLIESAPGWPLWECLPTQPEWRAWMVKWLGNVGYDGPGSTEERESSN